MMMNDDPSSSRRRVQRLQEQFERFYWVDGVEFTPDEARFITQPEELQERNRVLARRLTTAGLIVDAFACVGGDAVSFALDLPSTMTIHAVQVARCDETRARVGRLERNLRPYGARATVFGMAISEYLQQATTPISLLYLDPPWYDADDHRAFTAPEIVDFLESEVFAHLQHPPLIVCAKVPFPDFGPPSLAAYRRRLRLPVMRGRRVVYWFHLFFRE